MSAVIEIPAPGGMVRATIDEQVWTCSDSVAEEILNAYTDSDAVSPSQAQPDIDVAHEMAAVFNGTVVKETPVSRDVPGEI